MDIIQVLHHEIEAAQLVGHTDITIYVTPAAIPGSMCLFVDQLFVHPDDIEQMSAIATTYGVSASANSLDELLGCRVEYA